MSLESILQRVLTNPQVLAIWAALVAISAAAVLFDLRRNNAQLAPLMQFVWVLTTVYSGPIGAAAYWWSGRRQIAHDSLWRRGLRSVAHCYSGCGAGEVLGVTVAAGVLALGEFQVVAITFASAYVLGFGLTVGPLVQEGVSLDTAIVDAFYSETPSIVVMEVVAIGVDRWLAAAATIGEPLFWTGLIFSLSIGLFAAYPVNVGLVAAGVKEGMGNPAAA